MPLLYKEKIMSDIPEEDGKWTHTEQGDKCYIVHTKNGLAWVSYERSICDCVVPMSDLKPIKPKITKAEFADFVIEKLNDGTHQAALPYLLQKKLDESELIE